MFCYEFSNMRNIHYNIHRTRDTNTQVCHFQYLVRNCQLLILHEFKLFLILYAKCKCNITTSKEDKPPYQHNTRHTMHRRTIITPPSPCHLVMMNECQLVEVLHLRMPILPIHISFCVLHFRGYKRLKCNKLHPN